MQTKSSLSPYRALTQQAESTTHPCLRASRQQSVWQVTTEVAKSRSGTAHCEVTEEAGQEEEAVIKQHPLNPSTKRFTFGVVERKGGCADPFLRWLT